EGARPIGHRTSRQCCRLDAVARKISGSPHPARPGHRCKRFPPGRWCTPRQEPGRSATLQTLVLVRVRRLSLCPKRAYIRATSRVCASASWNRSRALAPDRELRHAPAGIDRESFAALLQFCRPPPYALGEHVEMHSQRKQNAGSAPHRVRLGFIADALIQGIFVERCMAIAARIDGQCRIVAPPSKDRK